jgi:predicted metal-dependent peptidase
MSSANKKKSNHFDHCGFCQGLHAVKCHPVFRYLAGTATISAVDNFPGSPSGWSIVSGNGIILTNRKKRGSKENWSYVIAHSLLHLGFDHFRKDVRQKEWQAACCVHVGNFLNGLKFGKAPDDMWVDTGIQVATEERLLETYCDDEIPAELARTGTAGEGTHDMSRRELGKSWRSRKPDWQRLLANGLFDAATSAINVAGGLEPYLGAPGSKDNFTAAQKAKRWFVSSYPLLGAIAAAFKLIESAEVCSRMGISVAAVNPHAREIYINPSAGLDEMECRFVMAHEFLHAALAHDERCAGRDHYLWNVACDFVINDWLVEMQVGEVPTGLLLDQDLKGLSAESIYDRIVKDMRRYRKLSTLRGKGDHGDILPAHEKNWRKHGDGVTLDDFYRRCLAQGLAYHYADRRGTLPAGLIEEINALSQPPIPWDVELAQWFDSYFPPLEKSRSYARPSRRQASAPDIPRPRYLPNMDEPNRTLAVILDTSGSMDRTLLAKALGAIASYSIAREVPAARVIFCDALPYDQGYITPESLMQNVQIKGRGGTVLQPAIDLLEKARDFPATGPILIITDGYCDRLRIRKEHAFLMPEGARLQHPTAGKVFSVR